jgi:hypothetical protein
VRRGPCPALWCVVVWRGVVWCGVVWCGVVWCGVSCIYDRCCVSLCVNCKKNPKQPNRTEAQSLRSASRRGLLSQRNTAAAWRTRELLRVGGLLGCEGQRRAKGGVREHLHERWVWVWVWVWVC